MNATASAISAATISKHTMDNNTFLSCVSIVTVANKVASNLNNKIAMAVLDGKPMIGGDTRLFRLQRKHNLF